MPTQPICPYCSARLQKLPQRKSKCPHCGEAIHVKRPYGSPQGTKMLMTSAEAEIEETKWRGGGRSSARPVVAKTLESVRRIYREELEQMAEPARAASIKGVKIKKPRPTQYGEDRRTGPQCERWSGRMLSVEEALAEMPLPCGVDCVCQYSPVFRWE